MSVADGVTVVSRHVKSLLVALVALAPNSGGAQSQRDVAGDERQVAIAAGVDDGSSAAPACVTQHPPLLRAYRVRPPWRVAGVDYCVGYSTSTVLKSPATISMAGVKVNAATKSITVTGDNVTLDGYDFAGWSVVTQAANTRLVNSNFNGVNPGGTQTSVISGTMTSSNLYVGYCTIDGLTGGGHAEFLVEMEGPGLTIEYSWLKNSNSDLIGRHGVSGGDLTIQYNLTEQAGMGGATTHGDYLQVYGPQLDNVAIRYNTSVQVGGITQGWIIDNAHSGEFSNNTLIGDASYWVSANASTLTAPFVVQNNDFVIGGFGFAYGGGANDGYPLSVYVNNKDMVSGEIVQDSNVAVPTSISSYSADSGVAGDGITNDSTLTLTGAAAANSTVKVFDGSTQIGTATANASGAWSYTTAKLADGTHSFTADSGTGASTALSVKIDTVAPNAPTIGALSTSNVLSGSAEANSTVKVFDGTTQIGTATANASGAWTYSASQLSAGSHSFTATATDAAGNTGATSAAFVTNASLSAPTIASYSTDSGVAGDGITNDNTLTLTGTAAANSTVKLFDGATLLGQATANGSGAWSYTTATLSNGSH